MKHLVLIDGNNLVLRCFHAMSSLENSRGDKVGGVYGFVHVMRKMVSMYQGACIIVTWDRKSERRRRLFPDYKANRILPSDAPKEKIEQREAIGWNLKFSYGMAEALGLPSVRIEGLEADDIIAHLVKMCPLANVTIVSTDKDFYQLLDNPGVVINRSSFGEHITRSDLITDKGYTPLQYRFIHTFTGDKSDNIPGVKGVGQKTITDIATELSDEELDMSDPVWWEWMYNKLGTLHGKKPKSLRDNLDILKANFQLVDLIDTPLLTPDDENTMDEMINRPVEFNSEKLQTVFAYREFESMDAKYVTSFESARWAVETRAGDFIRSVRMDSVIS